MSWFQSRHTQVGRLVSSIFVRGRMEFQTLLGYGVQPSGLHEFGRPIIVLEIVNNTMVAHLSLVSAARSRAPV